MKKYFLLPCLLLTFALSSCDQNRVFEKNKDFADNSWAIADIQEYKFEIKDTSKKNAIYYEYYNLYLKHTLVGPDGKQISTNLHELFLMDKTTGEPLGEGAGDIF